MISLQCNTSAIRICLVTVALSVGFGSVGASLGCRNAAGATSSSRRMADGKQWTTRNLDVAAARSYCYENEERNCRQYGRLYTWEQAQQGCQGLGDGWRLPTEAEWRQLAKQYGGVHEDAADGGKAAYKALLTGGNSGFDALLGGGRAQDGQYARQQAHGFYWTATEIDAGNAWFYNFARGQMALFRQDGGEKERSFSVRCVRE